MPLMFSSMTLREQLVRLAQEYAEAKGLSLARVSAIVMNGGHVLPRLATGEVDITTTKLERAIAWFSKNWPDDRLWPAYVRRPQESEAA